MCPVRTWLNLAHLDRETSNTLFEVFEDWEHQLQASDFSTEYDELEEQFEEPQP